MLLKQTHYNYWANQTLCNYILKAGETLADIEQTGSFSSVRKTLLHIWDAQVIWYARLQGTPLTTFPSKEFKGSLAEAVEGLLKSSQAFIDYVQVLNKHYDDVIAYQTLDSKQFENTVEDIVFQCMNHSTYHRGQIINLLRGAGFIEVGSTDYMRYCRMSV